jgi:hypothetical protein
LLCGRQPPFLKLGVLLALFVHSFLRCPAHFERLATFPSAMISFLRPVVRKNKRGYTLTIVENCDALPSVLEILIAGNNVA